MVTFGNLILNFFEFDCACNVMRCVCCTFKQLFIVQNYYFFFKCSNKNGYNPIIVLIFLNIQWRLMVSLINWHSLITIFECVLDAGLFFTINTSWNSFRLFTYFIFNKSIYYWRIYFFVIVNWVLHDKKNYIFVLLSDTFCIFLLSLYYFLHIHTFENNVKKCSMCC